METSDNLLPTPSVKGNHNRKGLSKHSGDGLATAIQSISSPGAAHASLFPLLGKGKVRKMIATSGLRCYASYESFIRAGSSVKTLAALLLGATDWYSSKSMLTWKVKVTKSKRLLFQLAPLMRRIDGIGSGLLPTKSATSYGSNQGGAAGRIGKVRPSIETIIKMLPTASARDWKGSSNVKPRDTLDSAVEQGATKGQVGQRTGFRLQPRFVEWMMGYPDDWTALPDSKLLEMRLSRRSRHK